MIPESRRSPENAARSTPRVAILIPCYNEELTIGGVVRDFRKQLPDASIYVFDNNSHDRTVEEATAAGARVFRERRQGKGYVVQTMFRVVDADVYVMVDGDATYPAAAVHALIAPVVAGEADMVIGSRLHADSRSEFHLLNRLGNRMYRRLTNTMFGQKITDLLSGYRAFSRRLVRGIPLFGGGFETETELTIKSLQRGYAVVEVPVDLVSRPEGSSSKIRIVRDGLLILNMILTLVRDYKPLTFFGAAGLTLLLSGIAVAVSGLLFPDWLSPAGRWSGALLLGFGGVVSISVGLILHTITRHFQELDSQLQMLASEWRRRGDGESEG
ncbi:MAG TPA: glycosyltransferase [Thermoanaerobaculia bacterium]